MNRIAAIALTVAATIVTSGTALAQEHTAKATVPFNFAVGAAQMPAGTYTIASLSSNGMLIQVRDREQKINIQAMCMIEPNARTQNATLLFHKYGDRYFLSEVRYPNSATKVRLVPTRAERKAKKGLLESSIHVESDVLVAMDSAAGTDRAGQ